MKPKELLEHVKKTRGFHYHSFDFGDGCVHWGHSNTFKRNMELPWTMNHIRGARVFDMGCSSGFFLTEAARMGAQAAVGLDADLEAVQATKFLLENWMKPQDNRVYHANFHDEGPYDQESWDLVLCFALLHHMVKGKMEEKEAQERFDKAVQRLARFDSKTWYLEIICNKTANRTMTYRQGFDNNIPSFWFCLDTLRRHFGDVKVHCRMPAPALPRGLHEGGENGDRYLFICRRQKAHDKRALIMAGPPACGKSILSKMLYHNVVGIDGILREVILSLGGDDSSLLRYEEDFRPKQDPKLLHELEWMTLNNALNGLDDHVVVEGYHFRFNRWRQNIRGLLKSRGYTNLAFHWIQSPKEIIVENARRRGEKFDNQTAEAFASMKPEEPCDIHILQREQVPNFIPKLPY